MGPQEPEADNETPVEAARARRGLSLIVFSLVVIALTGLAYVRPSFGPSPRTLAPPVPATYQLAAVDFVTPTTGWFVATFDSGRFVLLQTKDGGQTWKRELTGQTNQPAVYMHFFDSARGVVVLMGGQPTIFRTSDGGRTWSSRHAMNAAYVLSASFVDPDHGWLLTRLAPRTGVSSQLLRTLDGGVNWTNLGSPVVSADEAYRVQFTDAKVGWLESLSARPYAYKSVDSGATWRQVSLPAPRGGWPKAGQFFVAAQATQGVGVLATVANFAPTSGRSGIGAKVVAYPPLTVRTFDGGVPVFYWYATFVDTIPSADMSAVSAEHKAGSSVQVQAPNQVQLGSLDGGATWSVIEPPNGAGAVGYSDALNWWWIGSGAWSTSSDGGTTWTPYRNAGVLPPLPGSLQVLDSRHAWFAAMAGTEAVLETTQDGGIHWAEIGLPIVKDAA
ncbi:MAG TPA: hypothetical protein VGS16_13105 [Candidatus Dormibacteraeota bacterium]|nr:hypothetical protein [Candidatus Dormibacteraeota bacterium]